jgi:hypothetical protein
MLDKRSLVRVIKSNTELLDMLLQVFLKRAHELKDEGNRRFQSKDYSGALEIYEQALKLTPEGHPDRAVFYRYESFQLMPCKAGH